MVLGGRLWEFEPARGRGDWIECFLGECNGGYVEDVCIHRRFGLNVKLAAVV
jgi:hypothetical protein